MMRNMVLHNTQGFPIQGQVRDALLNPSGGFIVPRSGQTISGAPLAPVTNAMTGLGGAGDNNLQNRFRQRIPEDPEQLKAIYEASWAAQRFIDMRADDMLALGRRFIEATEEDIQRVMEAERELGLHNALNRAIKLGRLMGTAFLIPMTIEAPLSTPFVVENMFAGDFEAVRVFDRRECRVLSWIQDFYDKRFGQPAALEFRSQWNTNVLPVHGSRPLRFDGRGALSDSGWGQPHDRGWGLSALSSVMWDLANDSVVMQSLGHLIQEASTSVLQTSAYPEALTGENQQDPTQLAMAEQEIFKRAQIFNSLKSIFGMVMISEEDKYNRVDVRLTGWAQLLDAMAGRLAAVEGIPATRFLGRSPVGLNATGDSDMVNYSEGLMADQVLRLTEPYRQLDLKVARHVGLAQPLKYEWIPLTDLTEKQKADVSRQRVEAVAVGVETKLWSVNKGRTMLSGDTLFGELEDITPDEKAQIEEYLELGQPDPMEGGPPGSGGRRTGSPRRSNETSEPSVS